MTKTLPLLCMASALVAAEPADITEKYREPAQKLIAAALSDHEGLDRLQYLVEARWRKDQPTEAEVSGFQGKVERKLESTRGLFVAVQGVRPAHEQWR